MAVSQINCLQSCKSIKGVVIDLFCTFFATEEGPFGAETFCQVKLSTTCLTLKNQQMPTIKGDGTAVCEEECCHTQHTKNES